MAEVLFVIAVVAGSLMCCATIGWLIAGCIIGGKGKGF